MAWGLERRLAYSYRPVLRLMIGERQLSEDAQAHWLPLPEILDITFVGCNEIINFGNCSVF